eukprot:15173939-Alexandrium_andersonii.AAC.1
MCIRDRRRAQPTALRLADRLPLPDSREYLGAPQASLLTVSVPEWSSVQLHPATAIDWQCLKPVSRPVLELTGQSDAACALQLHFYIDG